ncbi:UNVERIFIED_CONTAM: hypothetical protein PYX00_009883 [Menopon gallinae]|uniref:Flavin-containing monooxygenase n=1 Tax=Menopon gallinae TaxID=328185 RepID=A0AAW2HDH3_9NEOP
MYRSLRTNLPKEVMGYPDYPILKPADRSYIPSADILKFLNEFTDSFDIRRHIKFRHWVKRVTQEGKKWIVETDDVVNKQKITEEFDAVMVCNGHYEVANIPKMKGQDIFEGRQLHSHDYRVPEAFAGQTVVIIGAGPSGLDIGLDVSSHAKTVYLSHHLPDPIDTPFPSNFYFKPDIKELKEKGVSFVDGTYADVDCVFYCTGYKYSFPFLSEDCGVKVRDNYVHPLYKHLISVENPTLCFVGLPFYVCAFSMFDLQVRFRFT